MGNQASSAPNDSMHLESRHGQKVPEHIDKEMINFIQSEFKRRQCSRFLEQSLAKRTICFCGYARKDHSDEALQAPRSPLPWNLKSDTVEDVTDAFGEVCFGGKATSKYVRVSKDTNVRKLLELMVDHWRMDLPTLVISVTGGAQNFNLNPRLKQVFRRGLIKAASSTGAWIVTGGTNAGVMKHVGEAVRDYTLKHGSKKPIVNIGIATWGCINNRHLLVEPDGCWPANYTCSETMEKGESALDMNHSHFIFVDDGTRLQFGVEIELRARLQRKISQMKTSNDESVSIPIVLVVLEGGPNTLHTVKSAIENGTPAIIVEGSGRAADILSYAYNNSKEVELTAQDCFDRTHTRVASLYEDHFLGEIAAKVEEAFGKCGDRIGYYVDQVRSCIDRRDHMTIFRLDGKSLVDDIDITILKALLKTNRGKRIDQLKLALAWDRADIAKEDIYTDDSIFETNEIHDLLYMAILQNKVEFVRLFLTRGVSLRDFATVKCLLKLYNDPLTKMKCKPLYQMVETGKLVSFRHVGELMKLLLGEYYEPTYLKSPYKDVNAEDYLQVAIRKRPGKVTKSGYYDTLTEGISEGMAIVGLQPTNTRQPLFKTFDDPAQEMFLWCVFVHMKEMAMVFWDTGNEDIAEALTAQHLLAGLKEREFDSDLALQLEQQSEFFAEAAVGVLSECYASDARRATLLLVREMSTFGQTTVLKMAVMADNKEFVAHPASQNLLTDIWMGRLAENNSNFKLLVTILLPFLAPLILKFQKHEVLAMEYTKKPMKKLDFSEGKSRKAKRKISQAVVVTYDDEQPNFILNYTGRLVSFFSAPFTTFCYNCIAYFCFLILYSSILLTDFYPVTSDDMTLPFKEVLLIIWIVTIFIEEIRQILMDEAIHWRHKFHNYVTDMWNVMDILILTMFVIGLILRLIPVKSCATCFFTARIILSINLMSFFFRVLNLFSIHKELGPKLVMIKNMMIDLFFFFIILLVFVISYGISAHVILYPNTVVSFQLVESVLTGPWWSIYGEFNVEDVSGSSCDPGFNSTLLPAYTCAAEGLPSDMCLGEAEKCPAISWLVPIMLGFYALIVNVMMLNLLIAMFSNTFATIHQKTSIFWKMQRYDLIREYDNKPVWPPPFIIIGHLYQLFNFCCLRRCCAGNKKLSFKMKLSTIEEKDIIAWENMNAEEYIVKARMEQEASMESQVSTTNKKVDAIGQRLDQLLESSIISRSRDGDEADNEDAIIQPTLPPLLDDRFRYIDEQLRRNAVALNWLISKINGESVGPIHLENVDAEREKDKVKKDEEMERLKRIATEHFCRELNQHKKSRSSTYIDTEVNRIHVPEEKVSFEVAFDEYRPSIYSDFSVPEADVDLYDPNHQVTLPFNETLEGYYDRKSCLGIYDVINCIPRNPKGRTGLLGRGVLPKWGPNKIQKAVLSRWEGNPGNSYLHCLLLDYNKITQVPEKFTFAGGQPAYTSLDECLKLDASGVKEWLLEVETSVGDWDYLDDPRNTDNAWLEVQVFSYHDNGGVKILEWARNNVFKDFSKMSWQRAHADLETFGSDLKVLYKVAKMLKAQF